MKSAPISRLPQVISPLNVNALTVVTHEGKTAQVTLEDILSLIELPTKVSLGLGDVDNTSDINKPLSTATALALSTKAPLDHIHSIVQVYGLQTELDSKASVVHTHVIQDVIGLQSVLDLKSDVGHTHLISDIRDLEFTLNSITTALQSKSDVGHSHVVEDVAGLTELLATKANVVHTHTYAIGDITGLQTALNNKANTTHTHVSADITDFVTAALVAVDDPTIVRTKVIEW